MLWLLLLIPVLGAIVAALLPDPAMARKLALGVTSLMAVLGLIMLVGFHYAAGGMYYYFTPGETSWLSLPAVGFKLSLGVDAISLFLVELVILLNLLGVGAGFVNIQDKPRQYYACLLLLMAAMIGMFVSRDLLLLYGFFELTLIPFFFLIGLWGGPDRRKAAVKFFLYAFTGSVFLLASVVYLGVNANSFDIDRIIAFAQTQMTDAERYWVVLGLLAGFAVKVPIFPVHSWLPLSQAEAPTATSIFLAGELGAYGIIRVVLPVGFVGGNGEMLFPRLIAVIGTLCVISIIYGALIAWVQSDMKKIVAYAAISHLGFCVLGLMSMNVIGIEGAALYMINHGISAGALLIAIGMIFDRFQTRDINNLSGLAKTMPKLAFFFVLFVMSSIGLPGLNGFVSEFLTILGAFTSRYLGIGFGSMAALGVILSAIYMLNMVAKVIWGPLKVPTNVDAGPGLGSKMSLDLNGRETAILAPLATLVVLIGVLPMSLMKPMLAPIERLSRPMPAEQVGALLSPSTGTPGEGRGEGAFSIRSGSDNRNHPHPNLLPESRERGPDKDAAAMANLVSSLARKSS